MSSFEDPVGLARERLLTAFGYVRSQFAQSQAPATRVLTDRHGRRMRASAYGRRPGGGIAGRAAGPTLPGWLLPTIAKLVAVVLIGGAAFVVTSKEYINFASTLPDARQLAAQELAQDTLIYASDGVTQLADLHIGGQQRYYEPLSAMGKNLPMATIDIEDANFWNEPGIDVTGIARAAWIDYREHRAVQGASTITQQLVKLRLVGNAATITRKIKEAVLAIQVSRMYSKSKILEMYLNTIFYGNDSYGAGAAARIYFHVDPAHLDLAQASMLAGIPRDPTGANPFVNWTGAKLRQQEVLDAMVRRHDITRAQAHQAYAEDVSPPNHMFTPVNGVTAPAFVDYVRSWLFQKFGKDETLSGGLRVYTTLNLGMQMIAQRDLRANLQQNGYRGFSQEALTAIDPHSGAVLAMVGSMPNRAGNQYNFAFRVPRGPGSSMKIYTYTAAIASGRYTMVTPIADTPTTISLPGQPPWQPHNYDNGYHGVCQLQRCMGNSYNVPAVKVELGVGLPAVINEARNMGAPPWLPPCPGTCTQNAPPEAYPLSTTLGAVGETPLQMATGASVLAAQGVLHTPFGVDHVLGPDGSTVFKWDVKANSRQVVDPRVAYIMAQIMSNNENRISAFGSTSYYLVQPNRKIAAKTGTTENFTDGWTVGFTPALTTAIWTGNADNAPMVYGQDAVLDAGPAFRAFMGDATSYIKEPPGDWYAEPPGLINVGSYYFLPGTGPGTPAPPRPSGGPTPGPAPPQPSPTPSPSPGGGHGGHGHGG